MKIESQVCTLEQAKRLKELGISQDSFFSWFGDEKHVNLDAATDKYPARVAVHVWVNRTEPYNNQDADHRVDISATTPIAAAFTVAELGAMFPKSFKYGEDEAYISTCRATTSDEWYTNILTVSQREFVASDEGYTEAEARAAMLIYLLENNLITAHDCNTRLIN